MGRAFRGFGLYPPGSVSAWVLWKQWELFRGRCLSRVAGRFCYLIAHKVTEGGDSHFSGGLEHLHFNVQACGNGHVHQGVEAE